MPKHTAWESAAILAFGITFLAVLLFIAKFFPDPTPFQYTIFRVVLALSAAGVAALTPHFLDINIPGIRAGGAFAVFVLVYSYSPASLVVHLPSSEVLPRIDDRGLVSWWKGEHDTTDQQHRNDGVAVGEVGFEQEKVGEAFGLRGKGFVTSSTTDFPVHNSDRTMEFWILLNRSFPDGSPYWASIHLAAYGEFGAATKMFAIGISKEFGLTFSN